jgi:hypothetical protein
MESSCGEGVKGPAGPAGGGGGGVPCGGGEWWKGDSPVGACCFCTTAFRYPRASDVNVSHWPSDHHHVSRPHRRKTEWEDTRWIYLGFVLGEGDDVLQPSIEEGPGVGKVVRRVGEHEQLCGSVHASQYGALGVPVKLTIIVGATPDKQREEAM